MQYNNIQFYNFGYLLLFIGKKIRIFDREFSSRSLISISCGDCTQFENFASFLSFLIHIWLLHLSQIIFKLFTLILPFLSLFYSIALQLHSLFTLLITFYTFWCIFLFLYFFNPFYTFLSCLSLFDYILLLLYTSNTFLVLDFMNTFCML